MYSFLILLPVLSFVTHTSFAAPIQHTTLSTLFDSTNVAASFKAVNSIVDPITCNILGRKINVSEAADILAQLQSGNLQSLPASVSLKNLLLNTPTAGGSDPNSTGSSGAADESVNPTAAEIAAVNGANVGNTASRNSNNGADSKAATSTGNNGSADSNAALANTDALATPNSSSDPNATSDEGGGASAK
ncbi:hypothetical protein A0H81_12794 [Grifola frondosa]|uniref:Uncharacterized protein n=1 Tax=Grifola frondosa TaxID=5627 RepID=A0A1C7LQU4_GRIFR|nr:hypothetical protein A0H81_12794 [Grifola frondosa]